MKQTKTVTLKKKPRKKPGPALKWQTGEYDRTATFKFIFPYEFLLLCKLMDTPPGQVLTDFMDNLSFSSWQRKGRDKAKEKLADYFIEHGYGQKHYSVEDIRAIFKEMDAMGMLWPGKAKTKVIDMHSKWLDKYQTWWFKKWRGKMKEKVAG